ncbi:MAG TPA: hypothetical protein VL947_03000, partial [Cytophagales bacterium]|nr:hypothetical protein [Cytophagales bacterium]
MVHFESEFVKIELLSDPNAILSTWIGFVPSAKYREALEMALELAKKHKIDKWISDIKSMKVISVADQEWASTEWFSRALSAGCYRKQAVIMSDDVFGQASAKKIITTA